jgi:hypothetical protein
LNAHHSNYIPGCGTSFPSIKATKRINAHLSDSDIEFRTLFNRHSQCRRLNQPFFGAKAGEDFVIAQTHDVGNEFLDALEAVIKSRCGQGYFKVAGYHYFPFATPDGMGFAPLYLAVDLSWDRASGSASEMPFPLDEILAGKSVTLETGTQSRFWGIVGGLPGDGSTVEEAVRVSFTAR